jgi:penicillin amidase
VANEPALEATGDEIALGSNAWVVSGKKTDSGGAMLANDIHMDLQVPNIWFRATFRSCNSKEALEATGITVPGLPIIVAGSNGEIAWGVTNSYVDSSDLVRVEMIDESWYMTADGPLRMHVRHEDIKVRGGPDVRIRVDETCWGPIVFSDRKGRPLALRWTAHSSDAHDMGLLGLAKSKSVEEAMRTAAKSGGAHLCLAFAGRDGGIGWALSGKVPRRFGLSGRDIASWARGDKGWNGWLPAEQVPKSFGMDQIVLANQKIVTDEQLVSIGTGASFAHPARARRIHDRLSDAWGQNEDFAFELQHDTRVIAYDRWLALFSESLPGAPQYSDLRDLLASWDGKASKESAAYRVLRGFRLTVAKEVLEHVAAAAAGNEPPVVEWQNVTPLWDDVVWDIIHAKPDIPAPPVCATWDEYLSLKAKSICDRYMAQYDGIIANAQWGDINKTIVRHPLTVGLVFRTILDMPEQSADGAFSAPLAQFRNRGPTVQMVVRPGEEEKAYMTMPVGQAGNPTTPYFGSGHREWYEGKTSPMLPGECKYQLSIAPAAI